MENKYRYQVSAIQLTYPLPGVFICETQEEVYDVLVQLSERCQVPMNQLDHYVSVKKYKLFSVSDFIPQATSAVG